MRCITVNEARLGAGLENGHLDATTLADYLVRKGVPFRTGHEIVGRCVAKAVAEGKQLQQIPLEELKEVDPVFEEDVYEFLGVKNAVANFSSYGGTGAERVAEQMAFWQEKLSLS